jgi:hypothetical protein
LFGPYQDFESQLEIKCKLLNCSIEQCYIPTRYGSEDLSSLSKHENYTSVSIPNQNYCLRDDYANDEERYQRSLRAYRLMRTRIKKQRTEAKLKESHLQELATSLELFELMGKSNALCAVSGVRGNWTHHSNKRPPHPFFLTFDHINPISRGGPWDILNIQVLAHCLNQVKGNECNSELIRWLGCFQDGMKKYMVEFDVA